MCANTYKKTIGHPVRDDEACVWNDNQGFGIHEKTPTNRTRGKNVRNTGELAVIDVRQLLKSDIHGGEGRHQTKQDRRVSH